MAKLNVVVPSNEIEVNGQKYRKVERKAQAGDIVKALTNDYEDVTKDAFYEITERYGLPVFYDNVDDPRSTILRHSPRDFEVYEKVATEYREVKRKANAGELIRIVDRWSSVDPYDNGAELTVKSRLDNVRISAEFNGKGVVINDAEYVVLEKVEIPQPQPDYREVKRKAKVGERIKITNASLTLGHYVNGDVFEIIRLDRDGDVRFIGRKGKEFLAHTHEYVVLEPVNYSEPAPQPERLKVGEYAKVVDTFWPANRDTIGDIVEILEVGRDRPSTYGIKFVKDGVKKSALVEHLVRATESEVEAAKKAAERTKNIGEFADGGYAEIVAARKGALTGFSNGDYVEVFVNNGGFALRVEHTNGTTGYCDADALRKVTREEYEAVTKPKPEFNVGDKVRIIDGVGVRYLHGFKIGDICEVTPSPFSDSDVRVKRYTDGATGYARPENIEKISAEEVARIEEEAKWAAIGRKVNEFKRGDIVEVIRIEGGIGNGHPAGSIGYVVADATPVALRKGNPQVIIPGSSLPLHCNVKLLVPVEQRFVLSEGGADLSK